MAEVSIIIDNKEITVASGKTVLEAARNNGIYIPVLCSHPDLKPFQSVELSPFIYQGNVKIENDPDANIETVKGCGICVVMDEAGSKFLPSCKTPVETGMKISTNSEPVQQKRRENFSKILANHPHSCLTCSQREGCIPMTDVCPGSVVFNERCCELLGKCEIQKIADYVGIAPETQRYQFRNLPVVTESPLFKFDFNICISCGRCVRVCQQVKGVYALGAVISNGKLTIGTTNGPFLIESECKFCGSCVEVCPTGAIMDKKSPRLKDLKDLVPCKSGCPGEVDIPQYLRLVSEGKFQDAAEVIGLKLPLPGVLGKVCFHPCETNCRRNEIFGTSDEVSNSINIRWIKDYAIVHSYLEKPDMLSAPTGKKVAVIGGGPAGLSAAYFLTLKGHSVDLYEKEDETGGLLRYGIPKYRLSQDVLEKDLNRIKSTGINFNFNKTLGKDFTINSLLENGTDAIFIAVGLGKSKFLNLNGNNENIIYGIEFLNSSAKGNISETYFKSKSVVIIGGGNVAIDAARSAVRYNAESVQVICLEQFDEMPAYKHEVQEAQDEDITIKPGWGISEIKQDNTDSSEIILKKCTRVFDAQGKFSPTFDDTIQEKVSCNNIIICIGQEAENYILNDAIINKLIVNGLIKVKNQTCETPHNGIYAAGDIVSGPASVIDAVGNGRKAAKNIDLFLGGDGIIDNVQKINNDYNMFIGRSEGFNKQKRMPVNLMKPESRKNSFSPIENTYFDEEAISESSRCLQCDLRLRIRHNPLPPEKYLIFSKDVIDSLPDKEGVVQILDKQKEVLVIKGSNNIRDTLLEMCDNTKDYSYFIYDLDPMFTKRESELIQQHLQKFGKLPDSGDDLDDLF